MQPRIGWIGLGRIGTPMATRVVSAGWPLAVWARRREAASLLLDAGAKWADSPDDLARRSDIVVTVVGGPADVQALHAQLMPAARPGTLFIDLSTAAPATARAAAVLAEQHGLASIEAPVTGGVAGAQRGTLSCFAGGDAAALERARPLLQAFAQRIVPCGPAGNGYRTKLVNQTLVAGVLMGLADGARLARAAGMDAAALPAALAGGTADGFLMGSYLPRMMGADGPVSFTLGLLLKDLQLARSEAGALGVAAPLLDAALATVTRAVQQHGAEAGVQRLAV
jgi:3-hydroxyisobutyrate dehydrogenase-like beta-hydroxyacid dehydrogenase